MWAEVRGASLRSHEVDAGKPGTADEGADAGAAAGLASVNERIITKKKNSMALFFFFSQASVRKYSGNEKAAERSRGNFRRDGSRESRCHRSHRNPRTQLPKSFFSFAFFVGLCKVRVLSPLLFTVNDKTTVKKYKKKSVNESFGAYAVLFLFFLFLSAAKRRKKRITYFFVLSACLMEPSDVCVCVCAFVFHQRSLLAYCVFQEHLD